MKYLPALGELLSGRFSIIFKMPVGLNKIGDIASHLTEGVKKGGKRNDSFVNMAVKNLLNVSAASMSVTWSPCSFKKWEL